MAARDIADTSKQASPNRQCKWTALDCVTPSRAGNKSLLFARLYTCDTHRARVFVILVLQFKSHKHHQRWVIKKTHKLQQHFYFKKARTVSWPVGHNSHIWEHIFGIRHICARAKITRQSVITVKTCFFFCRVDNPSVATRLLRLTLNNAENVRNVFSLAEISIYCLGKVAPPTGDQLTTLETWGVGH